MFECLLFFSIIMVYFLESKMSSSCHFLCLRWHVIKTYANLFLGGFSIHLVFVLDALRNDNTHSYVSQYQSIYSSLTVVSISIANSVHTFFLASRLKRLFSLSSPALLSYFSY